MASRIDFALLSQGMIDMCNQCCFLPGAFSDHTAIYLNVDMCHNQRGRGYWKFNANLLTDRSFLEKMNQEIEDFVRGSTELRGIFTMGTF